MLKGRTTGPLFTRTEHSCFCHKIQHDQSQEGRSCQCLIHPFSCTDAPRNMSQCTREACEGPRLLLIFGNPQFRASGSCQGHLTCFQCHLQLPWKQSTLNNRNLLVEVQRSRCHTGTQLSHHDTPSTINR